MHYDPSFHSLGVGELLGQQFVINKQHERYPRDFQVVAETDKIIRLKNSVEEYNVTRDGFIAAYDAGVFMYAKGPHA